MSLPSEERSELTGGRQWAAFLTRKPGYDPGCSYRDNTQGQGSSTFLTCLQARQMYSCTPQYWNGEGVPLDILMIDLGALCPDGFLSPTIFVGEFLSLAWHQVTNDIFCLHNRLITRSWARLSDLGGPTQHWLVTGNSDLMIEYYYIASTSLPWPDLLSERTIRIKVAGMTISISELPPPLAAWPQRLTLTSPRLEISIDFLLFSSHCCLLHFSIFLWISPVLADLCTVWGQDISWDMVQESSKNRFISFMRAGTGRGGSRGEN